MKKDTVQDRFEDTVHDLREAAELRIEALKLRFLDNFAHLFNDILGVFILVILCAIASIFIAAALTLWLAKLVGSLLAALLILAAVFILAALLIYLFRKKLFINQMVRRMGKVMFEIEPKK